MRILRALTPADAPAIAGLERQLHRHAELVDGEDRHRRHLEAATSAGMNLSYGIFEGRELIAYLLCFGYEPTSFPGEDGDVIYAEDMASRPGNSTAVKRLLRRFLADLRMYFPGRDWEAHAVGPVMKIWQRYIPYFRALGSVDFRCHRTGEKIDGLDRYVFRFRQESSLGGPATLQELLAEVRTTKIEAGGQTFEVAVLTEESQWAAIERDWDRLLLETPGHTVFQSFTYQQLWWKHFGADNESHVVVILRDGAVQGIAPLQVQHTSFMGRDLRELGFIGSRWEADRPTMLLGRDDGTLLQVLVSCLVSHARSWDLCQLYEQVQDAPLTEALQRAFRENGCLVGTSLDSECPYIDLAAGGWESFMAAKPQKFRKNIKAARRKLEEQGKVEYHVCDGVPELLARLDEYRELESRSWKKAAGVGVGRSDSYFRFYQELAAALGRSGSFVIRRLTVDGELVAATFGLRHDGVFYSLQIVHDSRFDRCSPGTYLEAVEIEECFRSGLREYEFLGGFLSNKSRWTDTFRYTRQLHIYRRQPRLVLAYVAYFKVRPVLRKVLGPLLKYLRRDKAE